MDSILNDILFGAAPADTRSQAMQAALPRTLPNGPGGRAPYRQPARRVPNMPRQMQPDSNRNELPSPYGAPRTGSTAGYGSIEQQTQERAEGAAPLQFAAEATTLPGWYRTGQALGEERYGDAAVEGSLSALGLATMGVAPKVGRGLLGATRARTPRTQLPPGEWENAYRGMEQPFDGQFRGNPENWYGNTVSVSRDPDPANFYARKTTGQTFGEGANVMPVQARGPFIDREQFEQLVSRDLQRNGGSGRYSRQRELASRQRVTNELRQRGITGVRSDVDGELAVFSDEAGAFPNVRSRFDAPQTEPPPAPIRPPPRQIGANGLPIASRQEFRGSFKGGDNDLVEAARSGPRAGSDAGSGGAGQAPDGGAAQGGQPRTMRVDELPTDANYRMPLRSDERLPVEDVPVDRLQSPLKPEHLIAARIRNYSPLTTEPPPLLVRRSDNVVLDGAHRLAVARTQGRKTLPVVYDDAEPVRDRPANQRPAVSSARPPSEPLASSVGGVPVPQVIRDDVRRVGEAVQRRFVERPPNEGLQRTIIPNAGRNGDEIVVRYGFNGEAPHRGALQNVSDWNGTQTGEITLRKGPFGRLYITGSQIDPLLQEKGLGTQMYADVADWAQARGSQLFSDNLMSDGARNVYPALARRGYDIRNVSKDVDAQPRNAPGTPKDERMVFTVASNDQKPIYRIRGRGETPSSTTLYAGMGVPDVVQRDLANVARLATDGAGAAPRALPRQYAGFGGRAVAMGDVSKVPFDAPRNPLFEQYKHAARLNEHYPARAMAFTLPAVPAVGMATAYAVGPELRRKEEEQFARNRALARMRQMNEELRGGVNAYKNGAQQNAPIRGPGR